MLLKPEFTVNLRECTGEGLHDDENRDTVLLVNYRNQDQGDP